MLQETSERHSTYCKKFLKQVLPFNKLTNYQLKALMLGKLLTSPKVLSTNNYILSPDEEGENASKTELMTPGGFYQINSNNSNNLFLHMNISSVSYHTDDLNIFIANCKKFQNFNLKLLKFQSAEQKQIGLLFQILT